MEKNAPLMEFDPEDVLRLKIQSVRPVGASLRIRCQKVVEDEKRENGDKWRIDKAA